MYSSTCKWILLLKSDAAKIRFVRPRKQLISPITDLKDSQEIVLLRFIHYTTIPCKALKAHETQMNFVSQAVRSLTPHFHVLTIPRVH